MRIVTGLSKTLQPPLELQSYLPQKRHLYHSVLGTILDWWIPYSLYRPREGQDPFNWQSHNLNYHLVQSCSNPVSQNQRLQEKSSDVPDLPVILQHWALETQLHAPGPSCITSPTDLDMLPFIVLSFKILLHTLNFLSSTERCKELSTTHKDIRMSLKWT